ncbi:hypothetical protein [Halobacillus campisalis]|uniref:hypothetical protein n=1 Tax=Halobacillus campisalis TaxID=435909 RepID=UPI0036F1AD25
MNVTLIVKLAIILGLICAVGNIILYYFYLIKTISDEEYRAIANKLNKNSY